MSTETIKVTVVSESEKALRVSFNGNVAWIPKSQIERMLREGDSAEITIPFWLYNEHWD